ncbi:hypothetical protein ABNG02_01005 [Halorubrum ejinorense]|uniref:Uncharacterized protein n=1 Tax=Halorubrum ejinorense TaxID=425309 RepID=A0AAV3SP73_9EURY
MICQARINVTDEREFQLENGTGVSAKSPDDDSPMSVVIDAPLAHLIHPQENICEACDEIDPVTIQQFNI